METMGYALVDEVLVVVEHVGGVTLFTVERYLPVSLLELGGGDIEQMPMRASS